MDNIRIVEIRILRGPNYWSCFRKELIQMKIDIGSYEELPTHKIEGFAERLEALLPSLHEHECSEMKPGGFFERVREGTWLGHVAEHIALELQTLAGMDTGYGRTRSTGKPGEYHMVYSYEVESAGIYAGKAALRLVEALAENNHYDVAKDIEELKKLKMQDGLGPDTMSIIKQASQRDIPVRRMDNHSLVMFGHGKYQQLIKSTDAGNKTVNAVERSDDKENISRIFTEGAITGEAKNNSMPGIDKLFPPGTPSRIPIVAVTGTNGKTTTVRLVAHMATASGYNTGYTSTDGVYIKGNCVQKGDCSGPVSAQKVLKDHRVDFAVLECARGSILRSGLGFDKCNTSILTNITDDHLGLEGIDSLRELTRVKAVVAHSTDKNGYAILNADDDRLYALRRKLDCRIALFSIEENSKRIREHCRKGGIAAIVEKGYFTVYDGQYGYRIAKVNEVPLTLDGRAECMVKNILPATLAAFVNGISVEIISSSLHNFYPSQEQSRGRMNIFPFRNFSVMVDYAHNTDGFRMMKKFMDQTQATVKVGIITSPGDRRDEDIRAAGAIAADTFDEIIIRHDDDLRGRSRENITQLLQEGISNIDKYIPVKIISDEIDAIKYAMDMAEPGSFIVVCTEKVNRTIEFLSGVKEFERSLQLSQQ